ncbi:MAG TPA: SRPBCC family protein [Gammaproteobacteria bacterium]|nr:SRPBCC family protein [Gammaproteobacteria bacterium]
MATVRKEILTQASAAAAWDAIRDVGALHTRLVPGFVKDTRLEGTVRVVTFGSGLVVREPIVTLDEGTRRLVWTAEGGLATHYSSSVQVFDEGPGRTRVVWQSDFLPDSVAAGIDAAMAAGAETMRRTLDQTAEKGA